MDLPESPVINLLALSLVTLAAQPIDGTSASRWQALAAWSPKVPAAYSVTARDGKLVFSASGAGTQLPFLLRLNDAELDADSPYLVVRYRATGLDTSAADYFLHGWEGTPGGLTLAHGEEPVADGQPQLLAIDLAAMRLQQPLNQLGLKVRVGADHAEVLVDRIEFVSELPAGAKVARAARRPYREQRVAWTAAGLEPMRGWTRSPSPNAAASVEHSQATFGVRSAGTGMRWRLTLPDPLDLTALPYLTFRYRATGLVSPQGYALWLGDQAKGSGGHSAIALLSSRLQVDGAWHTVELKLDLAWSATHLAVGLDADGEQAELTLTEPVFSSVPRQWQVHDVLDYQRRTGLPDGFQLLGPAVGGRSAQLLSPKLGLSDWFETTEVSVDGVPFQVAVSGELRQTGTAERGELRLALPATAAEIYLLTAVAAPPTEPFGIDPKQPRPIERLDVPEKAVVELRYRTGPPDELLPIDAAAKAWGFRRGLAVHVIHPDPARQATELIVHDRMTTASLAIVGATAGKTARVPEPMVADLRYPTPPAGAVEHLALDDPKTWQRFGYSGLGAERPPFEVKVEGQTATWLPDGQSGRFRQRDGGLVAECTEVRRGPKLELRLTLRNPTAERIAADIQFPRIGPVLPDDADGLWYLAGRRGGIINQVPFRVREPLGQRHPLQCDGFFAPALGLALACRTEDTVGQHHFVNLAKDETGGFWSAEYPAIDLAPGGDWQASPAVIELLDGDWRAIFESYQAWLTTWYQPPADKPWWRGIFAFLGRNVESRSRLTPPQRGELQPSIERCRSAVGSCDMVHLFGWSDTPEHGHWGDYDHYDQTVGGRDYFHRNIAAAQAEGVAVSLYLDGYLLNETSEFAGSHAKDWAMRTAAGEPWFVPVYGAYNVCPSVVPWQDYLSGVYHRLVQDTGAKVLYVDEYGATDSRWVCHAREHGHSGTEIPSRGEVEMLRKVRAAAGDQTALFCEYPPFEAARRYLDGSYTYQAVWSVDDEALTPHFVDLSRFAFPRFKQFHLIHYVPNREGNWWPRKIPFFNGTCYRVGEPNIAGYDDAAMAFQRRAIEVQTAHRAAFSSDDVTPLVATLVPGVFANRFRTPTETVWTLYNATGRTVREPVLSVPQTAGASYLDGWRETPLSPTVKGGQVLLAVPLGPKGIGCVVARRE